MLGSSGGCAVRSDRKPCAPLSSHSRRQASREAPLPSICRAVERGAGRPGGGVAVRLGQCSARDTHFHRTTLHTDTAYVLSTARTQEAFIRSTAFAGEGGLRCRLHAR